jgi:UPF0755 protein
MTGPLQLGGIPLDDDDDGGRRRPRRRSGLIALLAGAVVLILLGTAAWVGGNRLVNFFGPAPDYGGQGSGSVTITVNSGDTAADIGVSLKKAGVVKSAEAFRDAAASEPRSRSIAPGIYQLRKHMKASLALALLLDPKARVFNRIVIPEGTRLSRILEIVNKQTGLSMETLQGAADKKTGLGLPSYARGTLEGFLFPATYSFEKSATATEILRAMVSRFKQEATAVDLEAGARALGYTPYDVVTIASLVEKEARLAPDYAKVARVAYNRLNDSWGKPFGFDSTLNYLLPERKGALTAADLRIDSPYNSRRHAGLPPTPIDSPGRAALEAALHPTPGPWLYFVTIDQAGHTAFSTTNEQFLKDKATSRANGVK